MNGELNLFTDILYGVFVIFFIILHYVSMRKCFRRGNKNRVIYFLLTMITDPMLSYVLATFALMLPLRLAAEVPGVDEKLLNGDTFFMTAVVITFTLIGIIYTFFIFLFSWILAKWLNVPNKPLVTFVSLIYGVLFSLSLSSSIELADEMSGTGIAGNLLGAAVPFAAGILLFIFVIRPLSTLTEKKRSLNIRPFVIIPAIFCLCYGIFALSLESFMSATSAGKEIMSSTVYYLIYIFSSIIMGIFIWAFNVIIKNINSMNEALEAKEIAAKLELEEAKREADLSAAREIQTAAVPNVFPPFPDHKDFELYANMKTAKEVGGDFYDFYMLGDSTLGFLIADVSGKSIPGAMFMMTSKTVIRSLAENGSPPAEVFTLANEKLCKGNDAEMFVTAWLGYLDLKTGLVRIANAGHNPPVLIRNGNANYIKLRSGLVLAGLDGMSYKEQTVQLQKGDILYLYTDGVTEAMDKDYQQYGEDRLKAVLSFGTEPPSSAQDNGITEAVCRTVGNDIAEFTAGAEQSDDITMLCIRYVGN